jgi:hypothetical protein
MRTNCGVSSNVNLPFLCNEFLRFFLFYGIFFVSFDSLIGGCFVFLFTWNVFASAIAIGQLANVFTALGSGLIRCWLWVKRFGSCWQMTVNVDELLRILGDFQRWLQCWACGTSVNCKKKEFLLFSHAFIDHVKLHTEDEFHGRQLAKL